jgi:hypothetical protein
MICGSAGGPSNPLGFTGPAGAFTGGVSNCNPNFSFTELGSHTMWNPVPGVDIGVDVRAFLITRHTRLRGAPHTRRRRECVSR